jgi:hypothetical protein
MTDPRQAARELREQECPHFNRAMTRPCCTPCHDERIASALLAAEQRGRASALEEAAEIVNPHCMCDKPTQSPPLPSWRHRDLCPVSVNAYLLRKAEEAKRYG